MDFNISVHINDERLDIFKDDPDFWYKKVRNSISISVAHDEFYVDMGELNKCKARMKKRTEEKANGK